MNTIQIDLPSLIALLALALVAGLYVKYFLLEYSDRRPRPATRPTDTAASALVRNSSTEQHVGRPGDAPEIARAREAFERYDRTIEQYDQLVKRILNHPEFDR